MEQQLRTPLPGWHNHPNGGGLVQDTAYAAPTAYVGSNAQVSGNAQVYGDARVYGNARVYGDAQVSGNARVYGNAQVYGNARVYGDAQVSGNARVSGNAQVYGDAQVQSFRGCLFGQYDGHPYTAWRDATGMLTLAYGCETHTATEWASLHDGLARRHAPAEAEHYAASTRLLLALAEHGCQRSEWKEESA